MLTVFNVSCGHFLKILLTAWQELGKLFFSFPPLQCDRHFSICFRHPTFLCPCYETIEKEALCTFHYIFGFPLLQMWQIKLETMAGHVSRPHFTLNIQLAWGWGKCRYGQLVYLQKLTQLMWSFLLALRKHNQIHPTTLQINSSLDFQSQNDTSVEMMERCHFSILSSLGVL